MSVDVVAETRGFIRDAYIKNLHSGDHKIVSRYDATFASDDPLPESPAPRGPDPILDGVIRSFGGAFAGYAHDELGFKSEMTYNLLDSDISRKWDWGESHGQPSVAEDLRVLLALTPKFKILVAHGCSDWSHPMRIPAMCWPIFPHSRVRNAWSSSFTAADTCFISIRTPARLSAPTPARYTRRHDGRSAMGQRFESPAILNLAVAFGIGLLIGSERERRKGEGPSRSPAGIRTFTIASLAGATSFIIGGEVLLAVATAGVIILTAVAYWRVHDDDPGLTTEITLILTTLFGGLSMQQPALAAGLAVTVAFGSDRGRTPGRPDLRRCDTCLCSTDIAPLRCSYGPLRHPLAFDRFPG